MIRTFGGVTGLTNQPQGLDIGIGASSQWVHDWSAYSTVYDLAGTLVTVAASTWQTFVNVTGKGYFKWCRICSDSAGADNSAIRITVDGQAYSFDSPLAGAGTQGNEVNFEIPFKQSLKIEGFNRGVTSNSLLCDYLYLLQQSNPNASKVTLLQQSQRKMAYLNTTSVTLTDVINVTGSGYLLGIRFLGYYSSANGAINGDIAIDGTQKMTDRVAFYSYADAGKQTEVAGPIRFNSSLRVRTRTSAAGAPALCFAEYSLD